MTKEIAKTVNETMMALPDELRTAITLRELEGLSYEEIAVITQTEMGTVKSRIARARTKLQELLKPYLEQTKTEDEVPSNG